MSRIAIYTCRMIPVLFLFYGFHCIAQADVSFAKEFTIQSDVLNEKRQYRVRLPASYDNDNLYINKRYPVLVLLDADSHFLPVSGLVQSLSVNDELIPEMIIVAISNTDRTRDMTPVDGGGKSDAFVRFIEMELLKEIDQRYRTLPFRVLAGHSLAGLFAVDCFLDQHSFHAYIAIDPSLRWANEAIVKKAESVLAGRNDIRSVLYTAQAKNPFDTSAVDKKDITFKKFKAILERNKSERLIYKNEYFENEDHFSIPSIAFYKALLFVFDGYKIPLHLTSLKRTADIVQYYTQFQKRLGGDILPPGKLIDQAGLYLLHEKKIDQAIEILKVNEIYYPHSFITHQSLGEAYRAKGDKKVAIKFYTEALRLNPSNDEVVRAVRELAQ